MAVTKREISERLSEAVGFSKREAKDFVDFFFEQLSQLLEKGEVIHLSGFGNFDLRDKRERPGRNPRTGAFAKVSARRVVSFKAGHKLKNRVKSYAGRKEKN
ncbi:MAG: integration host factor subunit alpha [Gammaproteobacteria bacterium]|nr:integration host factor subunit alpha [Gammaproteobacteria bacterium]